MSGLAELVLSLCGLLEAEGRLLRENALSLTRRCVVLILGLLFGAVALACAVGASYEAMLLVMPKPVAIALMGLLCAVIACALLWFAREKCTNKTAPPYAGSSKSREKQSAKKTPETPHPETPNQASHNTANPPDKTEPSPQERN